MSTIDIPDARALARRSPLARHRSLLDVFDATVAAWGRRLALDTPGAQLTYDELAGRVRLLDDRLRDGGVGPGARVGVRVSSGTAELYVAILGVLAAGAAYVPVDADDPAARAEQIFADAGACAVLGDGLQLTWLGAPSARRGRPGAEDDAWIIFT